MQLTAKKRMQCTQAKQENDCSARSAFDDSRSHTYTELWIPHKIKSRGLTLLMHEFLLRVLLLSLIK